MNPSTVFARQGRTFKLVDPDALDLHSTLPVGTYTIAITQAGFHLERVDDMEVPPRLYGDVKERTFRILNTFTQRTSSLGVIFSGEKGSGKTMLAKNVSKRAAELGIITIVISNPWSGEAFNSFIQSIHQPAVILFDEFEKVYNAEEQRALLTLLDGTYSSKKLFILTCNDKWRVDEHMRNRPGRLFYSFHYGTLEPEFIDEYCQDNLINKDHLKGVAHVASLFAVFSFDMLKALVEEMNRYDESASKAMKWLNMDPAQSEYGGSFAVYFQRDGKLLKTSLSDTTPTPIEHMTSSPLTLKNSYTVWVNGLDSDTEDNDSDVAKAKKRGLDLSEYYVGDGPVSLDQSNLIFADARGGKYVFGSNKSGIEFVVIRQNNKQIFYNYDAF